MNGIAFFIAHKFHHSIITPVERELRGQFSTLISDNYKEIKAFNPTIIVSAEAYYLPLRKRFPDTILIFTRHGFSSKNIARYAFQGYDFVCLSSLWVKKEFEKKGVRPRFDFWVTGFPATDCLFHNSSQTISNNPPILLYAPTHDEVFHSMRTLGVEWLAEVCQTFPQLQILIKPHPVTFDRHPHWIAAWKNAAKKLEGVKFLDDPTANTYDLLHKVSILLTDLSSLVFYYTALDRPVIFVDPRSKLNDQYNYDPDGPEWRWRDMGPRVDSTQLLLEAIATSLENPNNYSEQRRKYSDMVYGDFKDGRSAQRIAEKIAQLLAPADKRPAWADEVWKKMNDSLKTTYQPVGRAKLRQRWWLEFCLNIYRSIRDLLRINR